nr:unnamed protein product [Callosobruchus chinensis]
MPELDKVATQIEDWAKSNKTKPDHLTTNAGIAPPYIDSSITVGKFGPIVLADHFLTETLQHFNRERAPERVVHAKGAGAFGYFQVTHDITKYSVAKIFESIGKKTPLVVRFSQVASNLGSADTVRDPRGFAIKFYTDDGNWDLVGNNTPIFFIRDPILFPMFIHSQKHNPQTGLRDWNMFWDFLSSCRRPETTHQVMFLFSDRGIPDGHRHMHGYSSHTYSLIGPNRKLTWVKFVWKTDGGIKNLDPEKATHIAGVEPDYAVRDLYDAIEDAKKDGSYPSWTFYIQTMTPEQAKEQNFNPFDITKVWPHSRFPLQPVGRLVLNRNPSNHFSDIEQLALNPSNMVPGVGYSPDRLLQGRLFAYRDTQLYRIGTNYEQVPVNRPMNRVANFERDGNCVIQNQGSAPNYHPNSFGGPDAQRTVKEKTLPPQEVSGSVDYYDLGNEDNFTQPCIFWNKVLDAGAKTRLVNNLVATMKLVSDESVRQRAIDLFAKGYYFFYR